MLSPYARPPPRPRCLIDGWLGPGWRLLERHEIEIAAPPGAALASVAGLRIRDHAIVRALFTLRGLRFSADMTLRELFSTEPFVLLDEDPVHEFVTGILLPGAGVAERQPQRSAADFRRAVAASRFAAVANFRAEATDGRTLLWTETWARTRGPLAAVSFGLYWLAIGPWSAWIRRMFLRAARDAIRA